MVLARKKEHPEDQYIYIYIIFIFILTGPKTNIYIHLSVKIHSFTHKYLLNTPGCDCTRNNCRDEGNQGLCVLYYVFTHSLPAKKTSQKIIYMNDQLWPLRFPQKLQ